MSSGRWASLRHRDFRLLWLGLFVSFIGAQMQVTAVNWQVFQLARGASSVVTLFGHDVRLGGEALSLGLIGLARVLPIFVFALIGGALADSTDRRAVMLVSQLAALASAALLAALTLAGQASLVMIYTLTVINSAASALGNPARQALVPNLVPRDEFASAVSLNSLIMQIAQIGGPALCGLLIGTVDIGWVYAVNAATFLGTVLAVLLMRYRDPRRGTPPKVEWAAIVDGVRFVFRERLLRSTMLLDFWATFFSSARTMLPIVAAELLKTDAAGYGLLSTAQAAGSLVAGLWMSFRADIRRQGAVLLASVAAYGAATALFGATTSFAFSYLLFAATGAADTVSTVIRNVIRQMATPDDMRGRMTGVNMIFFQGGPQLGELEAGLVGAAFGVPFAIVSGGVATVLIAAWMAWRYPDLRRYER
ncbi:MAG: MFS transporter [Chloroflexi bacterium]|nr:MFS transporter [Chloroflexota bacterium]